MNSAQAQINVKQILTKVEHANRTGATERGFELCAQLIDAAHTLRNCIGAEVVANKTPMQTFKQAIAVPK